jgi:hypothetical protein
MDWPPDDRPEQRGSSPLDEPGLDPEDAPLEVDADGFLVNAGSSRRFPTDLDAWVGWTGITVVVLAAVGTLFLLANQVLTAWATDNGTLPLAQPDGYFALALLGGVLLLVIRRGAGGRPGWLRAGACIAAGTGGAQVVILLVGNVPLIVDPSGAVTGVSLPPVELAEIVGIGVVGCTFVVMAAFAAVLAVLVYRRSRAGSDDADHGDQDGARVPIRRAVAALVIGMVVAAGGLVVQGIANRQNGQVVPASSSSPAVSGPIVAAPAISPGIGEQIVANCGGGVSWIEYAPPVASSAGTSAGGSQVVFPSPLSGAICTFTIPTSTASPAPSP